MAKLKIDKEKCIQCEMCVKDCITYCIEMDKERFPKSADGMEARCLKCGHCMAVCPTGALTIEGFKEGSEVRFANPDDMLSTIKSRRSIRQYKDEEISPELFAKLKEMLPFVPTGCNTNTLHFSIVETKSAMDAIRNDVNARVLKFLSSKISSPFVSKFARFKKSFESGEDIIFRGAPHMVVVSSSIHAPCVNVDPIIALSYIELYAQTLGLGTCWCGFAQACLKMMPEVCKTVDIPDGCKPVYVMLLGYPAVKYRRTTQPESFSISEIRDVELPQMSFTEKARRFLLNFIR